MIIRRAYRRACWEIDTVENNCDSLCCCFTAVFFAVHRVRVDSRNACESAPSCCRCRKQPAGWGRKRRRSTRERERPGSDGAESWSVTLAGCSTSSGRVRRRWRRWRGSRRWCTNENKQPGGKIIKFYFPLYDFLFFLCICALTVRKNLCPNNIPPFLMQNSEKWFYKIYSLLWISFETRIASCLPGGAGFWWATLSRKKYFIDCKGGEQSPDQRAGGGYPNPESEDSGKRDWVGEVRYFHYFPFLISSFVPFFLSFFPPECIDGLTINAFC